jgi:hypothetical protein
MRSRGGNEIPAGPSRTPNVSANCCTASWNAAGAKELTRSWCAPSPRNSRCERREHRPVSYRQRPCTVGCTKLKMQSRLPADSGGLFGGREGQSWAEKSLKNGRFLVEFQQLGKPQDTKVSYFPRNSPSALLEWGSGGRRFESSRPDFKLFSEKDLRRSSAVLLPSSAALGHA